MSRPITSPPRPSQANSSAPATTGRAILAPGPRPAVDKRHSDFARRDFARLQQTLKRS